MSIINDIQDCAEKSFGISTVKPYQLLVMHKIIENFDSENQINQIVIFPTGSGKSLCFLVPSVLCPEKTIIIYPLLALMNDQISKLRKNGLDCVDLRGGQSAEERKSVFERLDSGTKTIITNPETLNQEGIIKRLKKYKIGLLVIDEAHVISQWGKSFRPAYTELKTTVQQLNPRQILAFTATATETTISDITTCLFPGKPEIIQADADRVNIFYATYPVYSKLQGIVDILKFCKKPVIIFCGRRKLTSDIAMQIKRFFPDIQVRYYHAGLEKSERVYIENWFKNTEDAVLVTTCAYGLGVDLPGIRTIIHHDLPEDALEYLQESGRAGRDRKDAVAWVLVPKNKEEDNTELMQVFRGTTCRRQALLECLGEHKEECAGCDVCIKKIINQPYGYKEVMSFIKYYPFMYSINDVVGILTGNPFHSRYHTNPFYGLLDIDGLLLRDSIRAMNIPEITTRKKGSVLYKENFLTKVIAFIMKSRRKKRKKNP